MAGSDKYRRFIRLIPTQEQELADKLAKSAKQQEKLEKDLKDARDVLSPKARKKRTTRKKKKTTKTAQQKAVEKVITEQHGTREEQVSRLPTTEDRK